MYDFRQFFIDGQWVEPTTGNELEVIDPATEQAIGRIALGSATDVDRAVAAARTAFETYSETTIQDRIELLGRILEAYKSRSDEIARAISDEMGAPMLLAVKGQARMGSAHLQATMDALAELDFEEDRGTTRVVKEPIGVCGFITPWNWPINQIACKVAPALAAGCTMVLKPSELAPLSGYLFARVLEEAGVPPGVFNLVNGDGPTVGQAIANHPGIDMVSFTGSTRAGVLVAKAAANSVKRVAQELGGKSANILLDDADFAQAVPAAVTGCFLNSGQSCDAPTRLLVPAKRHDEVVELVRAAVEQTRVGDPKAKGTTMGPVVSSAQFDKIQGLIHRGIDERATLVTGGVGRPDDLDVGYYVKPTVFAGVSNDMLVAREEIFGPVLSILPYETEADAIRIANDTPYGLSGYVWSADLDRAHRVAAKLRAGNVHINGAAHDISAPFGGYKQSGNGREWGDHGIVEFLETKAITGYSLE